MSKKVVDVTPKSRIRNTLRRLWLYSRERSFAVKRAGKACEACGCKDATMHVHHKDRINWDSFVNLIAQEVLCSGRTEALQLLCEACHQSEHKDDKDEWLRKAKHANHSKADTNKRKKDN